MSDQTITTSRWNSGFSFWILGIHVIVFAIVFSSCQNNTALQQNSRNEEISLEEGFKNPPTSARPWAYWVWTNGNFNYSQLTRDLEEIKAKGMGGFDIFDIGERFPEQGTVPAGPAFLGKESLEAIHYAIDEADRLGLSLGLITSSSWNAGGSWVKPEHANMALFPSEKIIVNGPAHYSEKLPFPSFPETTPARSDGLPVFYKDIAVIAFPNSDEKKVKDISTIINITDNMNDDGQLEWDIPEGEWAIIRFICTNTGKMLHSPSLNSQGLVIDHFNPEATSMHFQTIIDRLQSEGISLGNNALEYLYLCSYEVWGISWTPAFQQEFLNRRGYSIVPYLPVLLGYTVQNEEISKRFYYDFEKTICDLIVDAHYKNATDISNKYGLQLCAESGGPGRVPVEALKALGALDIPRGEFWYNSRTSLVKEIASAAHIYGRELVDQEAFTSWVMWQEGPGDLKSLADNAFCNGMNKVTIHTFPHNPPEAGDPGWAYYAGTHIGPDRVWWPKVRPFMDYLARGCFLLRQGLFVGDVCYYYGDQGFNYVSEKHIDPSLGYGYDYDVSNPEVIMTRMEAKDGKIVLPDGMSYEILVLPEREDMDLDVLKKIQELVRTGITVVGPKPFKTNGLRDFPNRDEEVRKLAEEIWGDCDGKTVKENQYGEGKVIWGRTLREILRERGVEPDFSFTGGSSEIALDYIHRKTEKEDIYFVRNTSQTPENVNCTFRVKGKVPELWHPESGKIMKIPVYKEVEGEAIVPLNLAPEEAVFVVFREISKADHIASIKKDGEIIFPGQWGENKSQKRIGIVQKDDKIQMLACEKGLYEIETTGGKSKSFETDGRFVEYEITGPWEVRFPEGWGAPTSAVFPMLSSWTENADDGIKYFSGIATYYKEFEFPEDLMAENKQLTLDLGEVKFLADVYLNGKHIGILWHPPYRTDISHAVKPGKNYLVIEIANTWSNRLTGDARLPESERFTTTNIKHVGGPLKKGTTWEDTPLLKSGLMGPVKIIAIEKMTININ